MGIDQNTTNRFPTHFLRGVELVQTARKFYGVPSENWTYPTRFSYGWEQGRYYAELWSDGMDWQSTFWLLEKNGYDKPKIAPFIIFYKNYYSVCKCINEDFREFFEAVCWYRQDALWIKKDPIGFYSDMPWAFVNKVSDKTEDAGEKSKTVFNRYHFEHNSQPKVQFWIIENLFIPPKYRKIREKTNTKTDGGMTITTQYPSFDKK